MKYLKLCICGQLRLSKKHDDATPNTIMVLAAHQQMKEIIIASIKGAYQTEKLSWTIKLPKKEISNIPKLNHHLRFRDSKP